MAKRKNGERRRLLSVQRVARDRSVNVIIRSQLITAYTVLAIYLLLIYSDKYIMLPTFLEETKFILGGLVIIYVLWHTVNFAVSKYVIKKP